MTRLKRRGEVADLADWGQPSWEYRLPSLGNFLPQFLMTVDPIPCLWGHTQVYSLACCTRSATLKLHGPLRVRFVQSTLLMCVSLRILWPSWTTKRITGTRVFWFAAVPPAALEPLAVRSKLCGLADPAISSW